MPLQVRCPQCRQQVLYEGNPHRPFCSERCRRIDLGTWASGGYAIPGSNLEAEESSASNPQDSEDESHSQKE